MRSQQKQTPKQKSGVEKERINKRLQQPGDSLKKALPT